MDNFVISGNAFRSAIEAGYAKNTAIVKSAKWLGKDRIRESISKKIAENKQRTQVTEEIQRIRIAKQYEKADKKDDIRAALMATEQLNKNIDFYNANNASLADKQVIINIMPPDE